MSTNAYIPVVDHIKTAIISRVPLNDKFVSVSFTSEQPYVIPKWDYQNEYRSSVTISFSQIAPPEVEEYVREVTVREILRHVYGPVVDELVLIRRDLYRMGIHRTEVNTRIDNLINNLVGEE